MFFEHQGVRFAGIVGSALLLALAVPAPAQARHDVGGSAVFVPAAVAPHCALMRIGDQLVRCDSLTGAGTRAPSWVPEQR